ncbi:MAG: hypothetical protein Q8P30_03570 [Candidatus Uhrbacteria bacterium]|nr:hypothetical protein [Candidatus Uhrbacteria bacterium]
MDLGFFVFFTFLVCISVNRYGIAAFPTLFLSSILFYLVIFPLILNGIDSVTGAQANTNFSYYMLVMVYCIFYLVGIRLTAPLAFNGRQSLNRLSGILQYKNKFFKYALNAFLLISILLVTYSIISRNIFINGGQFLFTILGFDLLLVYYFIGRRDRSKVLNAIIFSFIILVFIFAGFRYRIGILIFTEVLVFLKNDLRIVRSMISTAWVILIIVVLSAFGQVRNYGSFSITDLSKLDFDLKRLIAASGEQTVSVATIAILDKVENIKTIGFEPIIVLATHFIPLAIYPNKPRASYLGKYLEVTDGLKDTGTAMHDVAQAVLMFGSLGLPFSAFLLGSLMGFLLQATLRLSPNLYFSAATVVLFSVFIPTRGYLAQQVTWALTFLLPVALFNFTSRLIIYKRKGIDS